ncbi:MAG TPA: aminodeoxychorismate/anthranilate synthase component II, partial [Balneolaceae bacterium]|nr:aminodeoxychorismate/anthranilate synthase component II [Balneolaceae bacterium]
MILIIDNYDSFTYNLVHLAAGQTDQYKVVRNDKITVDEIENLQPSGIIISPGPGRPADAGVTVETVCRFGTEIPILGVCLGHQAIGEAFGGKVIHAPELVHGKTSLIYHDGKGIFVGIEDGFTATRYHSLVLDPDTIPDEFQITARSENDVIMGIRHLHYPLSGIQFHPESYLTEVGEKIMANWIDICRKQTKA